MRKFAVLFVIMAAGCGESTPPSVGELGWTFDYSDWTKPNAQPLARDCGNQPANADGPPYDAIAKVHLVLEDPEGQIPGADVLYKCEDGFGDARVSLVGVSRSVFKMTLEGVTADGRVLYRHVEPELDLAAGVSQGFVLRAAVGELRFTPNYSGSYQCASGVDTLRYSFYAVTDTGTSSTAALVGETAACEGSLVAQLYLREIPVNPQPGANDNWLQSRYRMVLEALDGSDNVLHCASNPSRIVKPGNENTLTTETLAPGACN